ncbi:hypothetical protein AX14_004043 [Amanita brunnescens Koide BX004]|nr:hypothetical protein AX14_004043 [Amanita brunnescens Koide BX004]
MSDLLAAFNWNFATANVSYFAGNVISLFLHGALTVQLYTYYISFPRDPWLLKTIVYLIYVTETVYTILLTYDFGNTMIGDDTTWTFFLIVAPVGGGILAFLTQAAYAYRLRLLSQLKYVSWCILVLIMAGVVLINISVANKTIAFALILVWASISLAIDIRIAGTIIYTVMKNEMLPRQVNCKVVHLTFLTIGTGALTIAVNFVTVILLGLKSYTVCGPAMVLSKLYANSVMVFLNNRIPPRHACTCNGQAALEMENGPPGSFRSAIARAPADSMPPEQLALERSRTIILHEERNRYSWIRAVTVFVL